MMKKQIVLAVLLFLFFSCASQKRKIISKSTIKLEGRNTTIRDLIEIDGYYTQLDYPQYGSRMFFEDGTWVYFFLKKDLSENEIKANMSKSINSWIKNKQIRWGEGGWGVYYIQNDTIIVNRYMKGSFGEVWFFTEERYKIIDRELVLWISWRNLLEPGKSSNQIYVNDTFHFSPAYSLPSSNCWLKEEKWIWRNESDWKAYMEKIEQIKKQYKKK